jgi:hypothetical protein
MKPMQMLWLTPFVLALAAGCLDTATNEDDLPPVDQGEDPSGGDDHSSSGDGDGDGDTSDGDTSDGDSGDGDADAGTSGDGDGPVESVIDGTAESAMCTSYVAAAEGACYGYYCGVTQEMIAAELSSNRKCQLSAEEVCAGTLPQKVASCARSVKSNPLNAFDSADTIRMKTQACVYEDQAIKDGVSEDCLGCYLDGAQCASENCLTQCLTGDSANCDSCRQENNCNQPVPGCAGLPSPF